MRKTQSEHKIQSSGTGSTVDDSGCLNLKLFPVPKKLSSISKWCPSAFVVSFKLETDENILKEKCIRSIEKYGVDVVVGNILGSRKDACVLYGKGDHVGLNIRAAGDREVEEELVSILIERHFHYISEGGGAQISVTKQRAELRKLRDERLLRYMARWKQNLFLLWEYTRPFIGIGVGMLFSEIYKSTRRARIKYI